MAKETKRQLQVGETIKRNFSIVLMEEGLYIYGSEPLVSVTDVKMTSDLGLAKIYLSVYNTVNKQEVILMMEQHLRKLKSSLSQRIRKQMRRIPNIAFYLDETMDEIDRVDSLIDKLREDKQMGSDEEA